MIVVINCNEQNVLTGIVTVLQTSGFKILSHVSAELTKDQMAMYFQAADDLSGGVVEVLEVEHENDIFKAFASLKLEGCYASQSPYFHLRDKVALFPPREQVLQRAVAIVKPGYSEMDLYAFQGILETEGYVVLAEKRVQLEEKQSQMLYGNSQEVVQYALTGPSYILVVEKMNAIEDLILLIGPKDYKTAQREVPKSLRATFAEGDEKNFVYGSGNAADAERDSKMLFGDNPFKAERTVALIKPDAIEHATEILAEIKLNEFSIIARKKFRFTKQQAEEFYEEHHEKPFFESLIEFTCSDSVIALVLSKPAAIKSWRKLIGPINPSTATLTHPHSMRARFGTNGRMNAVHGSDSRITAQREIQLLFPSLHSPAGIPDEQEIYRFLHRKALTAGPSTKSINQILIEGLAALYRAHPDGALEAIEWLGKWLLKHNQNTTSSQNPNTGAHTNTNTGNIGTEFVEDTIQKIEALNLGEKSKIVFVVGGLSDDNGRRRIQCEKIVDNFGFSLICLADVLRDIKKNEREEAETNASITAETLSTTKVISLLKQAILSSGNTKLLLDGFPRGVQEALEFEKQICSCDFVLYFDFPIDGHPPIGNNQTQLQQETVQTRTGHTDSCSLDLPDGSQDDRCRDVLGHYRQLNKVKSVNASRMRTVEEIFEDTKQSF